MRLFFMQLNDEAKTRFIRSWTLQLITEHQKIRVYYRLPLQPIGIAIDTLPGKLGQFDPLSARLTLSLDLILDFTWDAVLEVLKHEMAHQYMWEQQEPDYHLHSETFRQTCRRLGMNEWAIKASTHADSYAKYGKFAAGADPQQIDPILRKAEKLLALTESTNQHEAALAMERVQELLARHQLELLSQKNTEEITHFILPLKTKRVSQVDSTILSILDEFYFVRVIYSTQFDPVELCEFKMVELLGTKAQVAMAEYVFEFLRRTVNQLWRVEEKTYHRYERRTAKKSFQLGILNGFSQSLKNKKPLEKAREGMGMAAVQTKALVALQQAELNSYVRTRFPRIQTRRFGGGTLDPESFHMGKEKGKNVTISRPIAGERSKSPLLLRG